jgi:AcrR family transcriptional regulator
LCQDQFVDAARWLCSANVPQPAVPLHCVCLTASKEVSTLFVISSTRQRQTAQERHQQILAAARPLFATRGYFGTPTVEIAAAAGLSHGYMFRLIGTKEALFIEVVRDSFAQIVATFRDAARGVKARSPEKRLQEISRSYADVIARRDLLLIQLQAAAACTEPAIREAVRAGYASIVEVFRELSGADDAAIQEVMALGMLSNFIAAMDAEELDEPWARTLVGDMIFKPAV